MTGENPKIYLSGIQYDLGDQKDISNLSHLGENPDLLKKFYKMGFKNYREHSKPMIEMAYYSAQKTLESAGLAKEDVDIVLYIAESKGRSEVNGSREVNELLKYLGIPGAYAIGLNLSDCANILMGLQVAYSLVYSGQAQNVLMVSTNKYGSKSISRFLDMDVAICSDGAVSALISKNKGDYEINGISLSKYDLATAGSAPLDLSVKKIKSLRTITKKLLKDNDLTNADISRVFINNYYELSQIFLESCGFRKEKGFFDNIPVNAHVLSGDTLINLKDNEPGQKDGERFLLYSDGPLASYATLIRKTG
ncbi:MAG: hypothetical protein H6605_10705 [Flavobacteriales bacterium]|nr:hypothetical protein [Flavobacteriales bacterium]